MKVGERGQITIPKPIRDRFGIGPDCEVEVAVVRDTIVVRKKPKNLNLRKWTGYCGRNFRKLGYKSVDQFIEAVRDK